eukprot:NODE_7124_length_791_cov_121.682635_g6885_i0.p1 GENE.NODE_7124_length_791_cov_121.682635_g6885_i0~~NODE_7124_length_791_cov_121.682635_g6885_i0.p1  ORF type:complete len:187 (+),score=8.77 NODE_7124_length_791_cov_121.682635_g6885_i0:62-622(+)
MREQPGIYGRYNQFMLQRPYTGGILTSIATRSISSILSQKVVDGKAFDFKELAVFNLYGAAYSGIFMTWCYRLYERLFNHLPRNRQVVAKVLMDNFVSLPLGAPTSFYLYFGLMGGLSFWDSYRWLQQEWWNYCVAGWCIWLPVQYINFRYVPPQMRLPFTLSVTVFWGVLLASFSKGDKNPKTPP